MSSDMEKKKEYLRQLGVLTLPDAASDQSMDPGPGGLTPLASADAPPNQSTNANMGLPPDDNQGQSVAPAAPAIQQSIDPNRGLPPDASQGQSVALPPPAIQQSIDPNRGLPPDYSHGQSVPPPAPEVQQSIDPNRGLPAALIPGPNQSIDDRIYSVTYKGQQYYGTLAQLANVKAAVVAAALKDVMPPLRNVAQGHAGYHDSLKALNDKQYIISWIVEAAGGADLGTVESAVANEQSGLSALEAAIRSDPGGAQGAFEAAIAASNTTGAAINTYMDKLDVGGGRTVAVLQVIEVTAFAVAASCGAAVLAPAGVATLTTTVASNAGFGALQAAAEEGAKLAGTDGQKDWGGAATNVGKAALLNGFGALLGGAPGKLLKGKVLAQILAKYPNLAPEAVKKLGDFVEGATSSGAQAVIANISDAEAGKMTWDQLATTVAANMLAGGEASVIVGAHPN